MILWMPVGCAPSTPVVLGRQPAIQTTLVLHVDPLYRDRVEGLECTDPDLEACSRLDGFTWFERNENFDWLSREWLQNQRTVDLQMGPDMALAWNDDPVVTEALASDVGVDPAQVRARTALTRRGIADLVDQGLATLGVHVHTVLEDESPYWGGVRVDGWDGGDPCSAWEGDDLQFDRPDLAERVVRTGVDAALPLAARLGTDLRSFTGYFPLTMANKQAVVTNPDDIDGAAEPWPTGFRPTDLGSAYMECFTHAVDHPPFETWPSDSVRALGQGTGPPVVPGARVPGSMAEHLGAATDGTFGANARRLLQLLVNWRYAGLTDAPDRPWTFTFAIHLFDLYEGSPDPGQPSARDLHPQNGQRYRGDLMGLVDMVDALAQGDTWQGVAGDDGLAQWILPHELSVEGSQFSYVVEGEAPPTDLAPEAYPYLPLVAERLADTHLVCSGSFDDVEVHGFVRCSAGWQWGTGEAGFSCTNADPGRVYLLIPAAPQCIDAPSGVSGFAPVDAAGFPGGHWCSGERLDVPLQGLILEATGVGGFVSGCDPL